MYCCAASKSVVDQFVSSIALYLCSEHEYIFSQVELMDVLSSREQRAFSSSSSSAIASTTRARRSLSLLVAHGGDLRTAAAVADMDGRVPLERAPNAAAREWLIALGNGASGALGQWAPSAGECICQTPLLNSKYH